MKVYTLKRTQNINCQAAELFSFFEDPGNLEKMTPASIGFEILTPGPIVMARGTVLDYTIRLLGLSIRWTTLIAEYDPPRGFRDVALRGPYSFWHHTHTFEDTEAGTVMTDEVRYTLPFGLLGRLVHIVWVRRQLKMIFDFRAQVIAEQFPAVEVGAVQSAVND